jgi:hypothetical protein
MKMEPRNSKGSSPGGLRSAQSHTPIGKTVASGIAKPEFKKHIHTNSSKNACDDAAAEANGALLSRRQLKNLAKRKKKEAAAAAALESNLSAASSALNSVHPSSASSGNAPATVKTKKAPLDPGKKAEVNCNWQALKKALVSGGPVITRLVALVSAAVAPYIISLPVCNRLSS